MVSAEDLQRALARQKEAGGTLDTALLELGYLPENRLVAALGRAADLPAAPLSAYEQIDARARRVFPSKVAERHGLAPFALDGRELSLVATCPVDLGLLDEVSFMLSLHLTPHVGPEWRVRTLIQRLYGGPLAPRLARLGEQSALRGTSPGVVAAVAPEPPPPEPAKAQAEPPSGIYLGSAMPAVSAFEPEPDAPQPTRPPSGFAGFSNDRGEPVEPLAAALSEALDAFDSSWAEQAPAEPLAAGAQAEPPVLAEAVAPSPPPELDRSAPPRWTLEQARAALAQARTRDEIVVTTLRYARDFFQFTALFAVTRDAVAGHDGLGPDGDARDLVRTVAIYAEDPGMFRTAIETMAPYLGKADRAAAGNQAVLDALGRGTPRTMLVTPILLRRRPVCLLYGDNGPAPVSARRLGDLLLFCSTIGNAFERIIVSRKGERPAPAAAPEPPESLPPEPLPPEPALEAPALEAPAPEPLPPEPLPPEPAEAAPVEAPALEAPPPVQGFFTRAEPAWGGPAVPPKPVSLIEAQFVAAGGSLDLDQLFTPPAAPAPPAELPPPAEVPPAAEVPPPAELPPPAEVQPAAEAPPPVEPAPPAEEEIPPEIAQAYIGYEPESPTPLPTMEVWPMGAERAAVEAAAVEPPPAEPSAAESAAEPTPTGPPELPLAEPTQPEPPEADPGDVIDDPSYLVGAFMTTAPGTPAHADLLGRLLTQAVATAPILCDLLPGPTEALASAPAEAQGPVFEALVAIGQPAVPPLLRVLTDADAARRRAAVVLLGSIGDPSTLVPLADRCLDPDAAVAEAAREALTAHRGTPAMRPIPERLRRALSGGLGPRAAAAARALSALRDVESIPNLIQGLEGTDDATASAAAAALATITLQRHGTQARKWMLWWKENRGRGRAEWLFGGLTAEDREVRAAAAAELALVAAPPVTYSPDQTAEQREQAARAWASWFTRSGYRL